MDIRRSRDGRSIVLLMVLLLAASAVHAQADVFPEDEYKDLTRISETVSPAGEHPFGERISLYDGTLSFAQTDIALPGHGPVLSLGRTLSIRGASESQRADDSAFADWDIDLPRISTLVTSGWKVSSGSDPYARCSHISAPPPGPTQPGGAPWLATAWWNGYHLVIPGQGRQELLKRTSENTLAPTMPGLSFPVVTTGQWQIACLSSVDNAAGEGFLAVSPDGTKYWFDHLVAHWAPTMKRPWGHRSGSAEHGTHTQRDALRLRPPQRSVDAGHAHRGPLRQLAHLQLQRRRSHRHQRQ